MNQRLVGQSYCDRKSIRCAMLGHNRDVGSTTENRNVGEGTQNVNVENPNMGKTTGAHRLQDITMRGIQRWGTETTISCYLFFANRRLQQRQRPLSLSLSRCTQLRSLTNIRNTTLQHSIKFALSHIYTNMTFGLFTHIAPGGSLEHIHICVPSSRSGRLPPGLQSSGSSHVPSGGTCFPT